MTVERYVKAECIIGEGPVWDDADGTLYFIDLLGNRIYSYNNMLQSMDVGENIGCAVLRQNGGMIAGLLTGWYFVDFPVGGKEFVCDPEADDPNTRFNDGKVDPFGRLWSGTMSRSLDTGYGEAEPIAGLYALDAERNVKTMLTGVIQGNGMAWSKDGSRFYFIDTQRLTVQEFAYDPDAHELADGRVCITVPDGAGIPDGMTIDEDGMLWVALWGGKAVSRWDPGTGKLLDKIELPALNVTSCCFGGEKMDQLFVTTASLNTDRDKYPDAGSVFRIDVGIAGAKSYKYSG